MTRGIAAISADPAARAGVYRLILRGQAIRLAVVVLALLCVPISAHAAGLRVGLLPSNHDTHQTSNVAAQVLTFLILAPVLIAVALLLIRKRPTPKLVARLIPLMPVTGHERGMWSAASAGAAVSEELLYRAVTPAVLLTLDPHLGIGGAVLLQALAFGLAHLYQGVRGVVLTAVVGLVFAQLVVLDGTIWFAMALHFAIDFRFVFVPSRWLAPDPAPEQAFVPLFGGRNASHFNPPPGWPAPPSGWIAPPGWQPDPAWPDPPPGWQLWQ